MASSIKLVNSTASIQGPEAFTESLSQGVQSLMGHVVGGTFGSAALITGSLGNTLALLSMDEDYKRKRRLRIQSMGTRGAPEAVIMAGRGFVMGVALGLSGIATKPIKGMQDEGIEGFFKGVGKGIMGLITKPAGGVIDIVAMAFEGVKRAAELGEDVIYRARIPRFINKNIGLQPYSPYQAVGQRMLRELCRGQYTESDVYFAHAPLSKQERPDVLLITDRHVFLLEKCRFWGTWDIDWFVNLEDIIDISGIVKDKLIFKVKQDNNLNPFSGEDRFIVSQDSQILHWVLQQLESALLTYRNTKEVWM
ncbi:PREDICTED: vacuolar protein sorting-associated protein 13A-like [Priapulus caudatus]|uniref:Vacuolar protein sorting-associated protein 13A-like n=1 Tax=Priapulus caudatus TaxID=37621 RepID=A0ABM1ERX9_PRICU|nr:PREDICTED: vacuolar protein sorting-associated protein 13A-like [Priapulus caudatus]